MPYELDKREREPGVRSSLARRRARRHVETPLGSEELNALFGWLNNKLARAECDGSLKHTREFLEANHLSVLRVVRWLQRRGGFCDCELVVNLKRRY